jgi:hypothetical protein
MKRFGESWGAPICDEQDGAPLVETPVGEKCVRCVQPIKEGDQGVILPFIGGPEGQGEIVYDLDCFLASLGIKESQHEALHTRGLD